MFLHALVLATTSTGLTDTFLSRISDNNYPAQRQTRTITAGALPPGWTSPVPLPQGVTIVGSVHTPKFSTEIFYEPADAAKALQAYLPELRAAGFSDKLGVMGHSGFGFTAGAPNLTVMCRGTQGVSIAQPAQDDLRVTISDAPTSPCAQPEQATRTVSPLPDLIPPPNSQTVGGGASGNTSFGPTGMSAVSSTAAIASPASLGQLFSAFASQMRAANWQPDRAFVTPQGGMQTFRYRSGPTTWRATMIIVPSTKPHLYDARIEATGTPEFGQHAQISPLRPAPQLHRSDIPGALQLVKSIASNYGPSGTPAALYVGRTPPELDKRVPLPAAHLVGSLRAGEQTTVYYEATRAQYDAYLARLKSAGWNPMNSGVPHFGGFATQFGNFTTFCKDGMPVLNVTVRPNSNDFSISPGNEVPQCSVAPPPFMQPPQPEPVPQLRAPQNASMQPGNAGLLGGNSAATITTSRSLSELLADFAAQMQAAKWSAQPPLLSDSLGSQTFAYTDPQGVRWQSVMTIYRSQADPKMYYAFIDATRLP